MSENKRLRSPQAAEYIGVSPSTLAKWRMRGISPPYHRCGPRIVFYYTDEIDQWHGDNVQHPEADLDPQD